MYTIDYKTTVYVGAPGEAGADIPTKLFEQAITYCLNAIENHRAENIYFEIRNWLEKKRLPSFKADRLASFCWLYFYTPNEE